MIPDECFPDKEKSSYEIRNCFVLCVDLLYGLCVYIKVIVLRVCVIAVEDKGYPGV